MSAASGKQHNEFSVQVEDLTTTSAAAATNQANQEVKRRRCFVSAHLASKSWNRGLSSLAMISIRSRLRSPIPPYRSSQLAEREEGMHSAAITEDSMAIEGQAGRTISVGPRTPGGSASVESTRAERTSSECVPSRAVFVAPAGYHRHHRYRCWAPMDCGCSIAEKQ